MCLCCVERWGEENKEVQNLSRHPHFLLLIPNCPMSIEKWKEYIRLPCSSPSQHGTEFPTSDWAIEWDLNRYRVNNGTIFSKKVICNVLCCCYWIVIVVVQSIDLMHSMMTYKLDIMPVEMGTIFSLWSLAWFDILPGIWYASPDVNGADFGNAFIYLK